MSIRILLLEDDQDLRFVLAQLLEAEGYQVAVAGRGQEAVALAQQQPFDLVGILAAAGVEAAAEAVVVVGVCEGRIRR